MGGATAKNAVKILFYIFNSVSVVGVGLILLSCGIGTGVSKGKDNLGILNIILGLLYTVLGILGYHGAIVTNIISLTIYLTAMIGRFIGNVVWLVMWKKQDSASAGTGPGLLPEELLAAMIFDTIITMVATLIAFTLIVYVLKESYQEAVTLINKSRDSKAVSVETSKTFTLQEA